MAGYQNPYINASNPYLQRSIDSAQGDLVRNYNLTTQPAFNRAMVGSGSFGNAGVQEMNENAQKNLQGSLGDISTSMRGRDFESQKDMYRWDQEFGRNTFNDAFGQNQSNLGLGMGLLNTLNQYNQQDQANATTIQNTPQQYYGQFANYANAVGGQGQTAQSTVGTSSSPITAALGGAQLGNAAGKWWRANYPGTTGTSGNSYAGSSSDPYAANYENQYDLGLSGGY